MNLIMHNRPQNVRISPFENSPYYDGSYGFWGTIAAVNSKNNCCDVEADSGYTYKNIPVATREWVNTTTKGGERNLPPVDSRVFVLMPTGTISGAFILCSGYAIGETESHNLYADSSTKDYCDKTTEHHSQAGWIEKENQETGNRSLVSSDGNISIVMNLADDSEHSETTGITITAWNHTVTITADKLEITAKKAVTITAENGLTIDGNNKEVSITNANTFKVNGNLEVSV